jgi:hypothetical protein
MGGAGDGVGAGGAGASLRTAPGSAQPLSKARSAMVFIQAVEDIIGLCYFIPSLLIQPRLL